MSVTIVALAQVWSELLGMPALFALSDTYTYPSDLFGVAARVGLHFASTGSLTISNAVGIRHWTGEAGTSSQGLDLHCLLYYPSGSCSQACNHLNPSGQQRLLSFSTSGIGYKLPLLNG